MATMYELEEKNRRSKIIRLIEFSDHIIRVNRRETMQLDARLRILRQQELISRRNYDRDISSKRLQLAEIYETLNNSTQPPTEDQRAQTPMSFYQIRMQRNRSAPPPTNIKPKSTENVRPKTTPTEMRRNRRAMSIFKDINLKATVPSIGDMLILATNEKKTNKSARQMSSAFSLFSD